MIYRYLQRILSRREESRKVNPDTDSEISETHQSNFNFAEPYIRNKKVLDVGCWTGQFEKLAIHSAKKIVAIDPDEHAIQFAKRTIKGPIFLKGTATKLQFKDKSFDVVTLLDVIEHIPQNTEITCLNEIHRVLRPKGILILRTNYKHPVAILFDPAFWAFGHRHYGKKELEYMLSISGFDVLRNFTTGGFWRISTFVIDMIAKHILRAKLVYPEAIKQKVWHDFKPGGIMTIHITARKR